MIFSPARSLIRGLFEHEEPKWIISDKWSACLQTLEGHSGMVSSVAFSHDSTRLASASYDDTVKIWDAGSGACLQTHEEFAFTGRNGKLICEIAGKEPRPLALSEHVCAGRAFSHHRSRPRFSSAFFVPPREDNFVRRKEEASLSHRPKTTGLTDQRILDRFIRGTNRCDDVA